MTHEIEINVKPFSINKAYKGRLFKTPELKAYETKVHFLLLEWR